MYALLFFCRLCYGYKYHCYVREPGPFVKERLTTAVHAALVELPDEVYQRAQRVAQATRHLLEEVVIEWIRPPPLAKIPELERLSNDELLQAARATFPPDYVHRLQELLAAQQQRTSHPKMVASL